MAHPDDILSDNRPLIKLLSNIMTCRTNDFDSPFISLPVGTAANKRRQKRVVNIYDSALILFNKMGRKNLHITGKHESINGIFFQKIHFLTFDSLLVIPV